MKAVVQAEVTKLLTYPGICQAAAVSFALNLALSAASRFGSNIGVATGHGITPIGDIGVLQLAPAYVFMLMGAFAAGSNTKAVNCASRGRLRQTAPDCLPPKLSRCLPW